MIPARLGEFQRLDLPVSEMVAGRIGYPHEAFMCFDYAVEPELPRDGSDAVVLISKGGRSDALAMIADHPGRVVVVAAPGDAPFRHAYVGGRRELPENVVAAFATSNLLEDDRIVAVPLGVRTSNVQHAKFVRQSLGEVERDLLLANFTVNAEHYRAGKDSRCHIRARLHEQLESAPWARVDITTEQRTAPSALFEFYAQLARHRFVISPEGNGIDCYRHWEALALGAVPVVMRSVAMAPFTSLPILFTDDYSELTADYLERQWDTLSERTFDIEPILMSSYRRRFLQAVAKLSDPDFICLEPGGRWSPRFLLALSRSPRSATQAEVAVPAPPFLRADSVVEPRAWRALGGGSASLADVGLTVSAPRGAVGGVTQRFSVVEGLRFRLRGGVSGNVRIAVSEAPSGPELAALDADGQNQAFELEFSASNARLWLSLVLDGTQAGRSATLYSIEAAVVL